MKRAKRDRGIYECAMCKKLTRRKDVQLDHIDPVIPVSGFDSFDGVVKRLLCFEEGWQVLCANGKESCHGLKTALETGERVHERQIRKRKL